MDLNDELENLALNAAYDEPEDEGYSSTDISQGTIRMYQEHFGYSYEEAANLVSLTKTTKSSAAKQPAIFTPFQARTIYILQLKGHLDSPIKVQKAAGMKLIPEVFRGESEVGKHCFCKGRWYCQARN
jgi:hypothetical protein